jgi:hypothetical protein
MLPAGIIDAGNLTAWDRPYEERQLPSWDAALRLCGAA